MKLYLFASVGISLIWMILPCIAKDGPTSSESLTIVTEKINQFNVDLYKELATSESGNLICSTLSATTVLLMFAYGAGGQSRNALYSTLHLPSDDKLGEKGIQKLIDRLNNLTKVQLVLTEKIYLAFNFVVRSEYIDVVQNSFHTTIDKLDFSRNEQASNEINNWATKQTNNHIQNILNPNDLFNARMVALNAVYFKGNWSQQFDPKLTKKQSFFVTKNNPVDVDMMFQKRSYVFGDVDQLPASFIELPYNSTDENDAMSMFVILPNEESTISDIENKINLDFTKLHNLPGGIVELFFPKFKINSRLMLEAPLTKLGLGHIFSESADFSRITTSENLYVSKIIQKAFIEVNEEGSEAVAVTAGVGSATSAGLSPTFTIDRPFIYYIVYLPTNTVLFQGHVIQPKFF